MIQRVRREGRWWTVMQGAVFGASALAGSTGLNRDRVDFVQSKLVRFRLETAPDEANVYYQLFEY